MLGNSTPDISHQEQLASELAAMNASGRLALAYAGTPGSDKFRTLSEPGS